jgi:hypothetical protein
MQKYQYIALEPNSSYKNHENRDSSSTIIDFNPWLANSTPMIQINDKKQLI